MTTTLTAHRPREKRSRRVVAGRVAGVRARHPVMLEIAPEARQAGRELRQDVRTMWQVLRSTWSDEGIPFRNPRSPQRNARPS